MVGTAGNRQIICIGTHIGIILKFDQEIIYVDCDKKAEGTEPWDRPSLKVLEGPVELFTRTDCTVYEPRR